MARLGIFGRSENRLRPVWQAAVPDHAIGHSWSPDSTRVAVAAVSGPITIFDTNTGKPLHQLKGHGFGTAEIAWQPMGNVLASVGQDSKVRLWDTATGQEVIALDAGATWEEKVLWHPSGQWFATAAGKKVRVWTLAGVQGVLLPQVARGTPAEGGELVRELPQQAGTVMDIKWRPGTNHLTLLAYGAATTYDPLTNAVPLKVLAWKGSPLALAWSPDGKILAHGNQDATVHFWYYDAVRDLQMWGYRTKVRELAWDFSSLAYLATGAVRWCASGTVRPDRPDRRTLNRRCSWDTSRRRT